MALYKEGCGHPTEWNLRVFFQGRAYTYCIGCIVEKLGLDNLEVYDCPFIKTKAKTAKIIKEEDIIEKCVRCHKSNFDEVTGKCLDCAKQVKKEIEKTQASSNDDFNDTDVKHRVVTKEMSQKKEDKF